MRHPPQRCGTLSIRDLSPLPLPPPQHPDNSVEAGEQLLWDVYSSLRNSSYWSSSALLLTYDEAGGFADHLANPQDGIPSPDGIKAPNGFGFDRLGTRVPSVLVSPWAPKGLVVHDPVGPDQAPTPTSSFEHTSIIASVNRIFGINENLTARDAWTGRFDTLLDGSRTGGKMRDDCPLTLPRPLPLDPARLDRESNRLLNDHHLDSIAVLCGLVDNAKTPVHPVCTGFSLDAERAGLLAGLRERAGERVGAAADEDDEWAQAAAYPTLHAPVARRLRQMDFGDISRALTNEWRAQVAREAEMQAAK